MRNGRKDCEGVEKGWEERRETRNGDRGKKALKRNTIISVDRNDRIDVPIMYKYCMVN